MITPRFEIVRTDAGWHSRFRAANAEPVWSTEVYTRRETAHEAIGVLAKAFSPGLVTLRWKDAVPIRDVDERAQ